MLFHKYLKNCKLKIRCLKNTRMHKILDANEAVVKQDLRYIAGDNIDYYNFLESNCSLANICQEPQKYLYLLTQ